jgi:hypothetical protein
MPREGYPHPLRSRDCQQTADPRDNLICGLDLTANADLHVIDQQRHALRMARVLECSRYGQTMSVFHSPFPYRQIRHVRPASDASRLNSMAWMPVGPQPYGHQPYIADKVSYNVSKRARGINNLIRRTRHPTVHRQLQAAAGSLPAPGSAVCSPPRSDAEPPCGRSPS